MANKDYIAVLDASLFVWDVADYKGNEYDYRLILDAISDMIEKLSDQSFLVTKELIDELIHYFPFSELPKSLWEFGNIIYKFLQNLFSKVIKAESTVENLVSSPNQMKPYFSSSLKVEVKRLLNHMYNHTFESYIYFSCMRFWNDSDSLNIINSHSKEVRAILIDKESRFNDFINENKLIFEHNPKHNCSEYQNREYWSTLDAKDDFSSQLTAFCSQDQDYVQEILDKRYDHKFGASTYYGFDYKHHVYVRFIITNMNVYHAHDEYDINKIPIKVKKEFRVHKYSWS